MQAKLPDINSALVRHRGGALVAVHQDNYAIAATELSAMNALLPVDYKVKIDDKIYYEKIRAQDVMVCNKCGGETEHASLAFYPRALSAELQLLYGVIMVDMWECSKCHHENPRDGTKRTIRKYEHPFYTGYMPKPTKDGFLRKTVLHIEYHLPNGLILPLMSWRVRSVNTEQITVLKKKMVDQQLQMRMITDNDRRGKYPT